MTHSTNSSSRLSRVAVILVTALLSVTASATRGSATSPGPEAEEVDVQFTDVYEQTLQFIEYYETIELTPAQERIKRAALTPLPAACCSNNSAYTCCCVCNLSRTVWGLTAHLITERDFTADQVQAAVKKWIAFVQPPEGFSGDACFKGGCGRSFANNGCGGMHPRNIIK